MLLQSLTGLSAINPAILAAPDLSSALALNNDAAVGAAIQNLARDPSIQFMIRQKGVDAVEAEFGGQDSLVKLLFALLKVAGKMGIDLVNADPRVVGALVKKHGCGNESEVKARLTDDDSGIGGMNQIEFPLGVFDYVGLTATWTLDSVSGIGMLYDSRLMFQDDAQILRRVTSVQVGGNSTWNQQATSGATVLSFVTNCAKYRLSAFTDQRRDGYRLGNLPLGNNTTITIIAQLSPGAAAPNVADAVLFGRADGGINAAAQHGCRS